MLNLLLIFLGGGIGCVGRYAVSETGRVIFPNFPIGTLTANVVGCFLIGLLGYAMLNQPAFKEEHKLLLIVGFLGGFTTFSTFGLDTLGMLQDGHHWKAALNIGLSNVLGITAVWIGFQLSQRMLKGEPT